MPLSWRLLEFVESTCSSFHFDNLKRLSSLHLREINEKFKRDKKDWLPETGSGRSEEEVGEAKDQAGWHQRRHLTGDLLKLKSLPRRMFTQGHQTTEAAH